MKAPANAGAFSLPLTMRSLSALALFQATLYATKPLFEFS
jgi:hypothetical protein